MGHKVVFEGLGWFFAAGVLHMFSQRKALLAQSAVQRSKNAVNTSVLGMVAKDLAACDNVSCSTSLRSMLYKEAKML